jgi:hypothetical protein
LFELHFFIKKVNGFSSSSSHQQQEQEQQEQEQEQQEHCDT